MTQSIHQNLGSGADSNQLGAATNEIFPILPGSHLTLVNPALEFVKLVCKVLSLDSSTRHQVAKLRYTPPGPPPPLILDPLITS